MTDRPHFGRRGVGLGAVAALTLSPLLVPIAAAPAAAAPDGSDVVINELYARGGFDGQAYLEEFVELYNPTADAVDLDGTSLQYRYGSGRGQASIAVPLTGTIEPGDHYLVTGTSNGGTGESLTDVADLHAAEWAPTHASGTVALIEGTTRAYLGYGTIDATNAQFIDAVGYGASRTYEGTGPAAAVGGEADSLSWQRDDGADTDDSSADFTMDAPTPQASGSVVEEPEDGVLSFAVVGTDDLPVAGTAWSFTDAVTGDAYVVRDNNGAVEGGTVLQDTDPADGAVSFEGVPAGSYTVSNERMPRAWLAPADFTVQVEGGEQPLEDIVLDSNGLLSVRVNDEAGEWLPGATLRLTPQDGGEPIEIVDNSEQDVDGFAGVIRAGGLPLGEYSYEIVDAPEGFEVPVEDVRSRNITRSSFSYVDYTPFVLPETTSVPGPLSFSVQDSTGYLIGSTVWEFKDTDNNVFTVADNNRRAADLDDVNDTFGEVEVSGIPAGEYTVTNTSVASPWRAPEAFDVTVTGDEQELDTFLMPGNGRISVSATDADGNLLPGATFRFTAPNGDFVEVADGSEADLAPAAGSVRAGGLEITTYQVSIVEAPEGYDFDAEETHEVTLTSGSDGRWAEAFVLTPTPGPLSFSVVNTLGDTVGSTGWLFTAEDGTAFYVADNNRSNGGEVTTLRDQDSEFGSVVVSGLPAGDYTVTNESPGSSAYRAPEPVEVSVSGDEQSIEDAFVMLGNASTSAYLLDADEEPVAGATFRIEDGEGHTVDVVDGSEADGHDRDGYVTFEQLELGTYSVTLVEVPQGYGFDESQELSVTLTAGLPHRFAGGFTADALPGPLSFSVVNTLADTVGSTGWLFTAEDGTAFYVADNNRSNGGEVTTLRDQDSEFGSVVVSGLPAGDYTVTNESPGSSAYRAPEPVEVSVSGDEQSIEDAFVMLGNASTSAYLLDADEEPVAGATFRIEDGEGHTVDVVDGSEADGHDRDGYVTFEQLELGTYSVTLVEVPQGYGFDESQELSVTLTAGLPHRFAGGFTADLVPEPVEGTITAGVETEDGTAVAGGEVTVTGPEGDVTVADGSEADQAEADGVITVSVQGVGEYEVALTGVPEGFEFEGGSLTAEITEESADVTLEAFVVSEVVTEPEPEPTPPTPGRGFYLNDGWDANAEHEFSFGRVGDTVLVGDWDGDGADTLAVRRGNVYYVNNHLYGGDADVELTFGRAGDTVLVGDWDGDGADTLAVRRGNAYFLSNSLRSGDAETELTYGRASDDVLVGDFDGDSVDTFTVRRGNTYFISNTLTSGWADSELDYGRASDEVYVGDWDGNGTDTFTVRRGITFFVNNSLTSTNADIEQDYGRTGEEVLVGDWNGDGTDTLGIRR
ncbi:MAG: SpaA isopeptide-forming pilin-related protein [Actinomycetaceae bacterium]